MQRIDIVKQIVKEAGDIALGYFGKTTGVRKKDLSIVTEADIKVGHFLTERLMQEFPGYGIINEEEEKPFAESLLQATEYVWVIDPIDGTASFNSRLPTWGIAVGLLKCSPSSCEGKLTPVMGMIYLPVMDEYYYTDEEIPAIFESGRWGKSVMDISTVDDEFDNMTFLCVTSGIHRYLKLNVPGKARSLGSTSAHFCYVARGDATGAIILGHLWDLVMGLAILKKAGGVWSYLDGKPVDLMTLISGERMKDYMVIASPGNLPGILGAIEKRTSK